MLPDAFLDHGDAEATHAAIGLDANGILRRVFEVLGRSDAAVEPARRA